jgi:hypothetical protein
MIVAMIAGQAAKSRHARPAETQVEIQVAIQVQIHVSVQVATRLKTHLPELPGELLRVLRGAQ